MKRSTAIFIVTLIPALLTRSAETASRAWKALIAPTLRALQKTLKVSRIEANVARIPVAAAMLAVVAAILIPQPAGAGTFGITAGGFNELPANH